MNDVNTLYSYIVTNVDLDMSIISLDLFLPDGSIEEINVDIRQISISDEDSELQLRISLEDVVANYIHQNFPKPPPKPINLLNLLNKRGTISI